MMGEIFTSPSRPFYQSTTILDLQPIRQEEYTKFVTRHFRENGKYINEDVISEIYQLFDGITWYIQFMMIFLYADTEISEVCTKDNIHTALDEILFQMSFTYSSLLYQLPPKQKEILIAICKEGKVKEITSSKFLHTYKVTASSVQGALKGLLEKDFVTVELGRYFVYDRFFEFWLRRTF